MKKTIQTNKHNFIETVSLDSKDKILLLLSKNTSQELSRLAVESLEEFLNDENNKVLGIKSDTIKKIFIIKKNSTNKNLNGRRDHK